MIQPIIGADAAVAEFVARQIPGCERGFGECRAIGFAMSGELVAGVVYHNWCPETGVIELSSASTRRDWLTKEGLRLIYGYPFDGIGCRVCVGRTSEKNKRVRRIWTALGAAEHLIPHLRGPDEAEIIHVLTAEVWRSGKFGR